jgi:predicted PurR-regulated permease PerM
VTSEPLPQNATVSVRGMGMIVIGSAVMLFVVRVAGPVLVPILVSILLAYALEPLIAGLGRLRLPRVLAAVVVYALIGLAATAVTRTARSQVTGFLDDLPTTISEVTRAF